MFEKDLDDEFQKIRAEFGDSLTGKKLQELTSTFLIDRYEPKSVLGLDIYKYSKMPLAAQTLIPYVLRKVYRGAIEVCLIHETIFFHDKSEEWFLENFVDTGDGFFQIFENPMQSLVFAIHFEAVLKAINSVNFRPEISMILDTPLQARYAITNSVLIKFEKNYYRPAIIDCSRIRSRDKLSRFLLDNRAFDYFTVNFNGIETLQLLGIEDLLLVKGESFYKDGVSMLFESDNTSRKILRIDCQQLQKVTIKNDDFEIFNLYLQVRFTLANAIEIPMHIVTIGNLNTNGL